MTNLSITPNNQKNRKSAVFYDLKGIIFPSQSYKQNNNNTNNNNNNNNSNNNKTYGCIVKHSIYKKWYELNNGAIK